MNLKLGSLVLYQGKGVLYTEPLRYTTRGFLSSRGLVSSIEGDVRGTAYRAKEVYRRSLKRYTARADGSLGGLTKENNIAKMSKDLFLSFGVPVLCGIGMLADVC